MKKIIMVLVLLFMMALLLPSAARADETESDDSETIDAQITARLNEIYETPNWDGGGQCYGFAKNTFRQLYGVSVNWSYQDGATSSSNIYNIYTAYTLDEIEELFSIARPGDVMAWNGTNGSPPHSSVIYENNGDVLRVLDANSDGNNTIRIHDMYSLRYVQGRMSIGGTTCVALFRYTPNDVDFNADYITLTVGQDSSLTLTSDTTTDLVPISWNCSNPDIVEIDSETGAVTSLRAGEVVISCQIGDKAAECIVTVQDYFTMPSSVEIKAVSLYSANAYQLPIMMNDSVQFLGEIVWSSSDEDVAIISGEGMLIGLKPGESVITANFSRNGIDYELTCDVNVAA